jgi:Family of unknown function (DUF5343)
MEPQTEFVPPYNIPWATFLSVVERIAGDPPSRIDRSYLDSQSGSVQTYLIAALKSFALIDQDARPTRILEFGAPDDRKQKMADLLREHYPSLVKLGETKATNDELREEFGKSFSGITGESRVKAIRFFLSGMAYADLPVSSLWTSVKAPRGVSARSNGRKPAPRKRSPAPAAEHTPGRSIQQNGDTYTVDLESGGQVAVVVDVNIFGMTTEDRDFVIDLVDKLKGYGRQKETAPQRGAV